ncbi:MAG: SH3 domain-containing protein [Verrucomicrobiae bacterium]|nr:SH3 domain-containing protein [Verrucomicrobiae bacterium]
MRWKVETVLLPLMFLAACLPAAEPRSMSIQVRETQVRVAPTFLAAVVTTVKYGDVVNVLESGEQWYRVELPGRSQTGWIHASALTSKRIQLQAGGDASVTASSGELALAGKGFNAAVEAEFKRNNKELDYTWVDRMERMNASLNDIRLFLEQGELHPNVGGGR